MLDNIQNQYGGTQSATDELKQEDLNQIAQKAGEAIKDHLLTADTTKSVFVVKEKIGKEERDGRGTYHYKAQVDKQHLKDFAAELKDKLNETKLKEVLGQRSLEETMDYDQLLKEIDGIDESKTVADVWVDRQAKLFSAIRFSEEGKPDNFVEFGTPYTGGDEVPFVVKAGVKEDDSDLSGDFRVTLNTKTNTSKLTLDASGKSQTSTTKVKATMTAKTNNTPVDVQKPTGAKTISELFGIEPDELIPTLAPTIPTIEG